MTDLRFEDNTGRGPLHCYFEFIVIEALIDDVREILICDQDSHPLIEDFKTKSELAVLMDGTLTQCLMPREAVETFANMGHNSDGDSSCFRIIYNGICAPLNVRTICACPIRLYIEVPSKHALSLVDSELRTIEQVALRRLYPQPTRKFRGLATWIYRIVGQLTQPRRVRQVSDNR